MMKVTNTTHGMLAANRAARNRRTAMVQRMKKDGTWGKPIETTLLFGETTAAEAAARLTRLNDTEYRSAE